MLPEEWFICTLLNNRNILICKYNSVKYESNDTLTFKYLLQLEQYRVEIAQKLCISLKCINYDKLLMELPENSDTSTSKQKSKKKKEEED